MQEENIKLNSEPNLLLSSGIHGIGNNKIMDLSLELLLISYRLSKVNSLETGTMENLKERLVNDILAISSKLSTYKQYDEKDIIKFRYCLCVFMDESLMKNELFISSSWANNTLTVRLFDETLGGDNFYDIALSWLGNPAKNKDFLEFIYACLILGYKGKYTGTKDMEEKITYLCNNIATSLTPLFEAKEELAFSKAYGISMKETWFRKFVRLHLKKILLSLSLVAILATFSYAVFDLETNNFKTDNNVSALVERIGENQNKPK